MHWYVCVSVNGKLFHSKATGTSTQLRFEEIKASLFMYSGTTCVVILKFSAGNRYLGVCIQNDAPPDLDSISPDPAIHWLQHFLVSPNLILHFRSNPNPFEFSRSDVAILLQHYVCWNETKEYF